MKFLDFLELLLYSAGSVGTLLVFPLMVSMMVLLLSKKAFLGDDGKMYSFEAAIASFAFGSLALAIGLIMALSREAVVGAIIPAAITLIGGLALYLVNEAKSRYSVVISSMVAFSMFLIFGTFVGSALRQSAENRIAESVYNLDQQVARAELEFQINTQRKARGLKPLDFSK